MRRAPVSSLLLLLVLAVSQGGNAQDLSPQNPQVTVKTEVAKTKKGTQTTDSPAKPQEAEVPSDQKIQSLLNAPVSGEVQKALPADKASRWRLGSGYAPILGMEAEFSVHSDIPTVPNVAGQNREYLDGYVKVDSSSNAGGETTNWGYGSDFQEVGGSIEFLSIDSSKGASDFGTVKDSSVAAAAGFEIFGFYEAGAFTAFGLKDKEVTWGFRAGAQYARVNQTTHSSTNGVVSTFTDSFNLGGNVAPGGGFAGTFFGPNQTLPDVADTRTFGSANVQVDGRHHLDVHLAVTQWGSYVQIPVSKGFDVMLEGGVILALASGTYDYTTRASLNSTGGQTTRGSSQRTRFLPGFYAGVGLTYELTQHLSLMTNVRYQFLRSYELTSNGSDADLDSSGAFVVGLSALWKF